MAATGGLGPVWVLVTLMVVTMMLSDVVNNNATAVLMAPLAIDLAARLQVSVDPLLMAVAIGASCAFLTPIGHQSNTLVLKPGGYRFGDYWRMGLPLEILIVARERAAHPGGVAVVRRRGTSSRSSPSSTCSGSALELFKVHVGSWSYPEAALSRSGACRSTAASCTRAWRAT
jgi:hypothetical protein